MPSTSQYVIDELSKFLPDVDDGSTCQYLRDHGYKLERDWTWTKPGTTLEDMTAEEYLCLQYLVEEWDFGGLNVQ